MRQWAWVALLLVGLVGTVPLAFASPPDPLWIGGLFDAGDTDDVVVAATSTVGVADGPALDPITGRPAGGDTVMAAASDAPPVSPLSAHQGRAPPSV